MLEPLGLDATTERVYRLLLKQTESDPAVIADRLDLSKSAVDAAVDRLIELSLLEPSREDPGRLRPVSPAVGLNALLAGRQEELALQQRRIEQTRAAVATLAAEYEAVWSSSGAMVKLVGPDAVRTRLEETAYRAQRECLSLASGNHCEEILDFSRPLDERALARGVAIRVVYPERFRNHSPTFRYAKWLIDLGGEVRTIPLLPVPLVIIDRKVAFVPASDSNDQRGAIEIRHQGIVSALVSLFEFVWGSATSFSPTLPRDEAGFSRQERELLRLLADGYTDQAVAREMGVSLRTIRRMVANLMKRLQARSRFQAGVRAAERGLITMESHRPQADQGCD